jgi:phosphatidate cytidylyltransferase
LSLGRRVTTAVIALPPLLLANFKGPPWLAAALAGLAALVGLHEFFGLLRARGLRPQRTIGVFLAAMIFAEVALPGWSPWPFWPLGILLLLTATLARGKRWDEAVPAAGGTLLGALYLGALGGTIAALRLLPPLDEGAVRVALLLAIIMAADTTAFFVGHQWGRRPLAPEVSPHKTIEGALGGLLGGVAGALVVRALGMPQLPALHAVGLGVAVAALGIGGDLSESLLKRWAGVKDSGTLFPGHGGMLDRLDSLLFGAPVLYYYFLLVP